MSNGNKNYRSNDQIVYKKRPPILVIRGQGWLFWLCYSMFLFRGMFF